MDALEAVAASPPFSARTITLNTIAAINQTDQKWCEEVGYAYGPDVPITEHWYVRRGYVSYKPNEPRTRGRSNGLESRLSWTVP